MLHFSLLPPADWPRLVIHGVEPFATVGLPTAIDHWRMIVAEDDVTGRIVACSSLRNEVLNDWWIAPETRRNPQLVIGLWRETKRILDAEGISRIHATVADPEVQQMIERLGYIPSGGQLYLLYVPDAILNEKD